jgi:hypothetical protein
MTRHRLQNGQTLGGNLNTAFTKKRRHIRHDLMPLAYLEVWSESNLCLTPISRVADAILSAA